MRLLDYEKHSDVKDYLLFVKRKISHDWEVIKTPRIHNSVEFAFCTKGTSHVYINEKRYEFGAGTMLFINRFENHRYQYMEGTECFIVVISTSFFNNVNDLKHLCFPTCASNCEGFQNVIDFLENSYAMKDKESMIFKTGFVNMLTAHLVQAYPVEIRAQSSATTDTLAEIIKYISDHFRENISVISLAKQFGYTPNYLSAVFHKYMGISFRDYLNMCRIAEYSKLMAQHPNLSVRKASELCGFRTSATFYSALKKAKEQEYHHDYSDLFK